jgi:rhomboid protease GluP
MSSFSFGEASNLCSDCKRMAANVQGAPYRPPVTVVILGINLLVFAAMLAKGMPITRPNSVQLLSWGADYGPLSLGTQPWRILTSNYVHIGIFHIFFNMWCLWDLGRMSEKIFGRWTYLLIYTACGIAGSFASLWLHPMVVGAGASGAIFGLAGALITALYVGKLPYGRQALRGMLRSLLTFAGYNLFFGAVVPGIDNSAHIGGLLMGLALGAVIGPQLMERPERRIAHERIVFVAALLLLIGFGTYVKHKNGYVVAIGTAGEALTKGRFDEAIAALQTSAAHNPKDPVSLTLLGDAYLEKKDYARAESTLKRALELNPNSVRARRLLGLTYFGQGQYEETRQIYATLIQRDPKDADAYHQLGLAQSRLNQLGPAIASLQQAARLDPANAETQKDLGTVYQAMGNPSEAAAAFHRAEDLSTGAPKPSNPNRP